MKQIAIIVIALAFIFAAGCITGSPQQGTPASTTFVPFSTDPLTQGQALPMRSSMTHTTPNTTFEVFINEFEVGEVQENGDQEISIYIVAKNTGTEPVQLVWFSKLTDLNGKTYGGIGISKGGVGARTRWIAPGSAEAARDFVIIRSDRDLDALKKGAVLDVYFIERLSDEYPSSLEPEYHSRWTIDAGAIPSVVLSLGEESPF